MTFTVGETVVYPNHGAAVIENIEMRTIKGVERQYLVLRIVGLAHPLQDLRLEGHVHGLAHLLFGISCWVVW